MQSRTKDERFLICLYEETKKQQSKEPHFNCYEIGKLALIQPKGVDAICALLLRTNFIRKDRENNVWITDHGTKLVLSLIGSSYES